MRLIDFFERGLSSYPERACLIDGDGEYSYRDVAERSHRTANALIAGGLKAEDPVAILSPNGSPAFEAWIGAARAGGAWSASPPWHRSMRMSMSSTTATRRGCSTIPASRATFPA